MKYLKAIAVSIIVALLVLFTEVVFRLPDIPVRVGEEMQALVQENRAKVVLAEAEVPQAIASAFRDGKLGVMDYYNMRNVQADTSMRNNIASMTGGAADNQNRPGA